jgi:hypothetical protein
MGSDPGNGRSNEDGARPEEAGLDLEAQAADAAEWLAGYRAAEASGESDADVGASEIEDPGLAGMVEAFSGAIDDMVAFDPVGRDGKDLLAYCVELNRQAARFASVMAQAASAYNTSGEWVLKGRSAASRVAHRCRLPLPKVNGQVRLGRNLARMPVTDEALAAGEISEDHARKLATFASCERTAAAFTEDEEALVGFARELGWREFCDRLKGWQLLVDPDGAEDNAAADDANRRVHLSEGLDGTGILDGLLTAYGRATVKAALDRIYDQLFEDDKTVARERLGREPSYLELDRTPAQRRHDALVRMAELSQQADLNGRRPAPLISVLMGTDALAKTVAKVENTGTVVTPGTVARIFDDHGGDVLIERIVFDGKNRVMNVGEARLFTGALRRAIEARDRTCTWPGCEVPAVVCQIDHIVEHSEGGPTTQENGQALCRPHNLIKERIRKLDARRRRRRRP